MREKTNFFILSFMIVFNSCNFQSEKEKSTKVITSEKIKYYVDRFNKNDNEIYKQFIPNNRALKFLSQNIPKIDLPEKSIEETYYFRWWTYRKHIKNTEDGFVITEFLPKVFWSKKHNTINCPAAHHIYEGRWLKDPKYISEYINLLAIVIGISKFLFNTDLISLSEDPVALKILFNFLVELPLRA